MKTYGLLGKNISYSLSPFMHNAAFRAMGIDAEYRIFDRSEDELDDFFLELETGKIAGCNVTIPYKEKALQYVKKYETLVKSIGALNTIARQNDSLIGYNTDCDGFKKALTGGGKGDLNFEPGGKSVFVFGAGGAARASIFALLTLGVKKIAITDIDKEKAEKLAGSVVEKGFGNALITVVEDKAKFNEFISRSDLLVNATPCGAKENDPSLFDYRYIHEKLCVFDLIYTKDTALLKEARSRGAGAVGGINMLLYQAQAAFTHWTDMNAPSEVMRKALLENIGK